MKLWTATTFVIPYHDPDVQIISKKIGAGKANRLLREAWKETLIIIGTMIYDEDIRELEHIRRYVPAEMYEALTKNKES